MSQQPMNRQQRRAMARQQRRGKAPNSGAVAIRANTNTMQTAVEGAAVIRATRRAQIMHANEEAFRRMREGVATFDDWQQLAGMVNVAQAIEAQGVVKGLAGHFDKAVRTLEAVYKRVQDQPGGPAWGKRTTLYFEEIEALREALHLHDFQLQQLSGNELDRARQRAINQIHSMRDRLLPAAAAPQPTPVQESLV